MTDVLRRTAREPDDVVQYGPGELHVADLYLPDSPITRVVVLVHGGFWRNRYDRTHLRPLAEALAARGYAVALPEYRRIGDAGGGHPGTFDDVALALAALPPLVARDRPTTVVGHSAGGQLALWSQAAQAAAGHPCTSVDRVIALAGVLDLAEAHRRRLSSDAVGEVLGASRPGFAERLAAVDPMQLPIAPPERVSTVLLHGTLDADVPVEFSRAYARRDPRIEIAEIDDAGHFELIDPLSAAFPVLLAALESRADR